ncbi:MAG TPA: energy transducer TonB [Candidatus Acidoferrales bacterium]|nr:energy transducer TonB [Candidatus Acidoferrales bacterium]
MNIRRNSFFWGLMALFAGLTLLPAIVKSQDADSVTKRKVIHRIVPQFPALARQLNISGKVKIEVTVEPDGHVKSTHALGGSPLLVEAGSQALKNWKFETGPKETTEIIEFDFKDQ